MPSSLPVLWCTTAAAVVLALSMTTCDSTWCEGPRQQGPVPVPGPRVAPCQDCLLRRVEGMVSGVIGYLQDVTCRGYRQLQNAFQPYRQQPLYTPPFR